MELKFGLYDPMDYKWRGLTITPAAAARICELTSKQPGVLGLRLGIKKTGCAGFSYVLNNVNKMKKEDIFFEKNGAKLFVSIKVMSFVDGTEVDYIYEGLNQLFKFRNPKAQNECGCGRSFGI